MLRFTGNTFPKFGVSHDGIHTHGFTLHDFPEFIWSKHVDTRVVHDRMLVFDSRRVSHGDVSGYVCRQLVDDGIDGAPVLAIEVLSPSDRKSVV